ncbi:hypothetical protein DM01DRAFT_1385337 [Hesseltinella vesiculosa]|uniref:Uncharacterized protein n=1 Tax=Hesseltinella vesiculosa TaxID=101127 RepID=A0A1X2GB02_9FUNG|nr:hypothetical protein DM01DRAFT_1385337 [Hesseltinella vesiculosa]
MWETVREAYALATRDFREWYTSAFGRPPLSMSQSDLDLQPSNPKSISERLGTLYTSSSAPTSPMIVPEKAKPETSLSSSLPSSRAFEIPARQTPLPADRRFSSPVESTKNKNKNKGRSQGMPLSPHRSTSPFIHRTKPTALKRHASTPSRRPPLAYQQTPPFVSRDVPSDTSSVSGLPGRSSIFSTPRRHPSSPPLLRPSLSADPVLSQPWPGEDSRRKSSSGTITTTINDGEKEITVSTRSLVGSPPLTQPKATSSKKKTGPMITTTINHELPVDKMDVVTDNPSVSVLHPERPHPPTPRRQPLGTILRTPITRTTTDRGAFSLDAATKKEPRASMSPTPLPANAFSPPRTATISNVALSSPSYRTPPLLRFHSLPSPSPRSSVHHSGLHQPRALPPTRRTSSLINSPGLKRSWLQLQREDSPFDDLPVPPSPPRLTKRTRLSNQDDMSLTSTAMRVDPAPAHSSLGSAALSNSSFTDRPKPPAHTPHESISSTLALIEKDDERLGQLESEISSMMNQLNQLTPQNCRVRPVELQGLDNDAGEKKASQPAIVSRNSMDARRQTIFDPSPGHSSPSLPYPAQLPPMPKLTKSVHFAPSLSSISSPTLYNATPSHKYTLSAPEVDLATRLARVSGLPLSTPSKHLDSVFKRSSLSTQPPACHTNNLTVDNQCIQAMKLVIQEMPNVQLRLTKLIPGPEGYLVPNPIWHEIYGNS